MLQPLKFCVPCVVKAAFTILGLADRTMSAWPSETISPWLRSSQGCWRAMRLSLGPRWTTHMLQMPGYSHVDQAAWRCSHWGCQCAVTGRKMTNYLSASIRAVTVLSTAPPDGPNYTISQWGSLMAPLGTSCVQIAQDEYLCSSSARHAVGVLSPWVCYWRTTETLSSCSKDAAPQSQVPWGNCGAQSRGKPPACIVKFHGNRCQGRCHY